MALINIFQPLTNVQKSSILSVAGVLDKPLIYILFWSSLNSFTFCLPRFRTTDNIYLKQNQGVKKWKHRPLEMLNEAAIMAVIFWDFLMFDQIFFSPHVKRSLIIINTYSINELPNNSKLKIVGNSDISGKSQNFIDL